MRNQTATPHNPSDLLTLPIKGGSLELAFSKQEDSHLLERLRQNLFQVYIQSLVTPNNLSVK